MTQKAYFLEMIKLSKIEIPQGLYKYREGYVLSPLKLDSQNPHQIIPGHIAQVRYRCNIGSSNIKNKLRISFFPVLKSEYSFVENENNPILRSHATQQEAFDAAVVDKIKHQEMLIEITKLVSTPGADPTSEELDKFFQHEPANGLEMDKKLHLLKMLQSERIKDFSNFFIGDPMPCGAHYPQESGGLKFDEKFFNLDFPELK